MEDGMRVIGRDLLGFVRMFVFFVLSAGWFFSLVAYRKPDQDMSGITMFLIAAGSSFGLIGLLIFWFQNAIFS
jgi:hypothetical protein